jgi:hypothetical protein
MNDCACCPLQLASPCHRSFAIDAHLEQQPIKPGQEWFWTAEWQAAEREAEEDLAASRVETFDNDADFLASLV